MIQIQADSLGQPYIEWAQIANPEPDGYSAGNRSAVFSRDGLRN
jgi:hypothetical protein